MFKKLYAVLTVISLMLSFNIRGFAEAGDQLSIVLNGIRLQTSVYVDSGSIYLPLREIICKMLEYKVDWSDSDRTVTILRPDCKTVIDMKNNKISYNEHTYYISGDYPGIATNFVKIIDDRMFTGLGLRTLDSQRNGMNKMVKLCLIM